MELRRRLQDRRATRKDGRRSTDERPTLSVVDALRELDLLDDALRGNGRWDGKELVQ